MTIFLGFLPRESNAFSQSLVPSASQGCFFWEIVFSLQRAFIIALHWLVAIVYGISTEGQIGFLTHSLSFLVRRQSSSLKHRLSRSQSFAFSSFLVCSVAFPLSVRRCTSESTTRLIKFLSSIWSWLQVITSTQFHVLHIMFHLYNTNVHHTVPSIIMLYIIHTMHCSIPLVDTKDFSTKDSRYSSSHQVESGFSSVQSRNL